MVKDRPQYLNDLLFIYASPNPSVDDELNAGILSNMIWFLHIHISQLRFSKAVFSWAWNKSNTWLWFSGKDVCIQCENLLN